jgi:hypothetical protein
MNLCSLAVTRRPQLGYTSTKCSARNWLHSEPRFLGFSSPTASPNKSSDQHREYRSRLCSAFRFSQPLDVLLRSCPPGLVSCQIRPWGWDSQRVPPPSSRHGFHRALPLQPYVTPDTGRSVGAAPKNDTSATPERTTPRHRSEKRRLDTAPNHHPTTLRRARRSSDPNEGHVAQGFMHLEGPFSAKRCYPTFAGRASLSLCDPLRGSLPSSLGPAYAGPPLMGLLTTMDESNVANALQSVKELKGRLVSLENCRPPWGFCPESDLT